MVTYRIYSQNMFSSFNNENKIVKMFKHCITDHPQYICDLEVDFAKQKKISRQFKFVFVPTCDVTGKYDVMQRHPETGERWCVDTMTGALIEGTKTKAGQPDPQCTGTAANSPQGNKHKSIY